MAVAGVREEGSDLSDGSAKIMSDQPSFFSELKRRNVVRMAGLYLVGAWLLVQVAGTLLPVFDAPAWVMKSLVGLLAVGLVPALIFSWVFELTPQGLKRDEDVAPEQSIAPQTGRRMNRLIIGVLVLALGYFAVDKFVLAPRRAAAPDESSSGVSAKSIAVLPFENLSEDKANAYFADGMQDEIITRLAKIGGLRVISRTSTQRYKMRPSNLAEIAKELGVSHLVEGTVRRAGDRVRINVQLIRAAHEGHLWAEIYDRNRVRQAGPRLRVAVQLVDTVSGTHLWAETYDRAFVPEDLFTLQDDLVPRIVLTVADQNGVLTRRMSETLRSKSEDALTPHEAALRAFTYFERVTPEEHAVVRRILERAVRGAPDHADCWAMLSIMYSVEFADDFNPEPNSLDRALAAADRAVHLAATHALGHYALAFVYFLRKETASFRAEAEKALALNPMDGSIMGILGVLINCAGELERGCQMAEAAMQLNPNHSALLRWAAFTNAYAQGKYAEALDCAVRINMPNYFYAYSARAAALGQLGRREAAEKELRELLALRPDFATAARREYAKWHDSDTVEHMIDGLRKAGLAVN